MGTAERENVKAGARTGETAGEARPTTSVCGRCESDANTIASEREAAKKTRNSKEVRET